MIATGRSVVICFIFPPYTNHVSLDTCVSEWGNEVKRKSRLLALVFVVLLVGWPVYHIYAMLLGHSQKQDAGRLLYQVSLFQMELLGSFLHDMDKLHDTDGLNPLRQAVYTANFAHEHLVLAYGDKEVTPLYGLSQLMQYVVRLQIGGQRPLKADEVQTLSEVQKQYADLYEAYGQLMSPQNSIVGSQNDKLVKSDKLITELLRKKLLQ
jgi:hypothetical protein